jgi:hypothetical protein
VNLLDREAIIELLTQLGGRLLDRGIEAEVYVVGGAAMTLAYNRSRATVDIDAVTERQEEVENEARRMAASRRDLPSDWFNGRVKPMLPTIFDREQIEVLSTPGLSVTVASAHHMIAMKARAARSEQDMFDLWVLCQQIDAQSVDQVLGIAESVWGDDVIRDENKLVIRAFLTSKGLPEHAGETWTTAEDTKGRCPGTTSAGTQCKRMVAPGTTCWQH